MIASTDLFSVHPLLELSLEEFPILPLIPLEEGVGPPSSFDFSFSFFGSVPHAGNVARSQVAGKQLTFKVKNQIESMIEGHHASNQSQPPVNVRGWLRSQTDGRRK